MVLVWKIAVVFALSFSALAAAADETRRFSLWDALLQDTYCIRSSAPEESHTVSLRASETAELSWACSSCFLRGNAHLSGEPIWSQKLSLGRSMSRLDFAPPAPAPQRIKLLVRPPWLPGMPWALSSAEEFEARMRSNDSHGMLRVQHLPLQFDTVEAAKGTPISTWMKICDPQAAQKARSLRLAGILSWYRRESALFGHAWAAQAFAFAQSPFDPLRLTVAPVAPDDLCASAGGCGVERMFGAMHKFVAVRARSLCRSYLANRCNGFGVPGRLQAHWTISHCAADLDIRRAADVIRPMTGGFPYEARVALPIFSSCSGFLQIFNDCAAYAPRIAEDRLSSSIASVCSI